MKVENWQEVKNFIEDVLNRLSSKLESDSVENVQHYIGHDEYEMAFEILFTEIMKGNFKENINYNMALKIGQELNLRSESVYDPDFWVKFETFCYNGKL